ncbi:unnamed protein product [marine sediment metagenome]|uniref:Uncharacterized protein n=1 Tax=marine sediment metagenome TaxID=412755 RepID=X0WH99_9ZZZZ
MERKGLATNMLILLVLALIALVIISIMIARSGGTYAKGTSCESTGGKCLKATECEGKQSFLPGCEEDEVCCMQEGG